MLRADHAAIVGGGFTGALLAINLLRHGTPRVTLIERDMARLARGLAYGASASDHILNVRAANMSAFPDQPGHFAAWLAARGIGGDGVFATRRDYGSYLAELLDQARQASPGRLAILSGEAADLDMDRAGVTVRLASGESLRADVAALASGNLPPHHLPAFAGLAPPTYRGDPWAPDLAEGLDGGDTVLLLGNGLTAVDCVLTLESAGFEGRIVALSRRGLAPHSHAPADGFTPRSDRPEQTGAALIGAVRARADAIGWRNAIDELRPFTQDLWRAADDAMRARFLRHLRPFWDVHRHRLAPQVAARLERLRAQSRLTSLAGKVVGAAPEGDGLQVSWRPRGAVQGLDLVARRVINCTGPLGDLGRTGDRLLAALRDKRLIRPDALAIGIDVDRQGRAIGGDGRPGRRLFVAGPMTRGAHWEIVAVPDIRKQVWDLARYLTHSQWVEAEGL